MSSITSRALHLLGEVRAAIRGERVDYTQGHIGRAILLLAVPMVLEMLMESLFNVVDMYFVAKLGSQAVAVVGMTAGLIIIIFAIAIGLSMGTTAMVARRIGEGDVEAARTATFQAIVAAVAASIPLGIVGAVYAEDLLLLLGARPDVAAEGHGFPAILLGGNATIFLLFLINAAFRGAGDPVIAMRALWIGNVTNMVLDPILIFGLGAVPALGIEGAAVATVIGRGVGVSYQVRALLRGSGTLKLERSNVHLDPSMILRLFRVSGVGILQFLIGTASWLGLIRILTSQFGEEVVAGYTIAVRVIVFIMLPTWGVANAAATLVGQNLGAGQPERAERSVWITGLVNMAFLACVTLLFLFASEPIVRIFTAEPGVVDVGSQCLRIVSKSYVFMAFGMTITQSFNGAGDTATPTWLNLFNYWAVQIPLAWFLAVTRGMGPTGVFMTIAIAQGTLALTAVLAFRRGRWKTRVI